MTRQAEPASTCYVDSCGPSGVDFDDLPDAWEVARDEPEDDPDACDRPPFGADPKRLREATDAALAIAGAGISGRGATDTIRARFALDDMETITVAHRVDGALLRLAFGGKAGA